MESDILFDENIRAKGYQVRVKGCLSEAFLAWLDLPGSYDPQADETLLLVATTDQAALYGLLNRLRDLGLTLVSVDSQPIQDL
jgi:prephenate dehydratase